MPERYDNLPSYPGQTSRRVIDNARFRSGHGTDIDIRLEYAKMAKLLRSLTRGLPKVWTKKVRTDVLRPAAQKARQVGSRAAPKGKTGNLRRSFIYRKKTTKNTVYYVVGPSWPKGAHGHLMEFGTGQRWTLTGKYRGIVFKVEHAFFGKALNRNAEAIGAGMAARMEAAVLKYFRLYQGGAKG